MAEGDPQVEIEVALRDSTSAVLRDISREIDNVSRKLVDTGRRGSEAFDKLRRGAGQSEGDTKGANTSLSGMSTIMGNMAKTMLGPVGLAAGFVAVGRAMETFAQHRVQLQALSADIGFTTGNISVMQQTFSRMGLSIAEGKSLMAGLGSQLKELATLKIDSTLFQQLSKMGEADFAKELLKTVESGDFDKAMRMIVDKYEQMAAKSTARGTYFANNVLNVNESVLQSYKKRSEGVKASYESDYSTSQEYLDKTTQLQTQWDALMGRTAEITIKALNEMDTGLASFANKLREWGLLPKAVPTKPGETVTPEITDEAVRLRWGLPPLVLGTERGGTPQAGFVTEQFRRMRGETDDDEAALPKNARPRMFSRSDITIKELSDTEKDSNRSLRDIRDILERMEGPVETPGGGGTESAPTTFRPGIRGGGGVGGQTRADRNNNPGNIKFGPFAKSQGATGSDPQGFAVFPDREAGFKAAEALLGSKGYAGLTLRQIGARWAAGDANWAVTVSKMTGIPLDAIPTPEQRSQIARTGIPRAEGTGVGADGKAGSVGGVQTSPFVRERQSEVARTRRGAISEKLRGQLDFAGSKTGLIAEVVSGGQRMHGAPGAVGSHRHDQGGAADLKLWDPVEKRYLDMRNPADAKRMEEFTTQAVRAGAKGVGAGVGYMGPSTLHIGGGSATSWGGAAWIERARRAGVMAGAPLPEEIARGQMDRSMSQSDGARSGKVSATVDFGEMAKQQEESSAIFKVLKMPSSRMHKSVREGEVLPGDSDYSTWTP